MSDDRQRFEAFIAKFRNCYQSVEVRVVCGLHEGQWRNIWTRMELRPEAESEIQTRADLPSTDAIKAIHVVSPPDRVQDLMDSVEHGRLSLGDTEVVYLRDGHRPNELGLPLSSFTPPDRDFAVRAGLEDWRSARLRANGPDLFWLRDEGLEDGESLPDPDVLAAEIADDLQAATEQFAGIAEELRESGKQKKG